MAAEKPLKQWTTPKLVALVRCEPAESVLQNCKYLTGITTSRDHAFSMCKRNSCGNCNQNVRS